MQFSPAQPKGDISTLPAGGPFFFALTALRDVEWRSLSRGTQGTAIGLSGNVRGTFRNLCCSVRPLPQAMGVERYNELRKLFGETMMSSETVIFAVSPAMSYLAKEMKDAAPSFWTVLQPADG